MNKRVFTLLISALASTASARDTDRFAFLQCGVTLGETYPTYETSRQATHRRDTRISPTAGAAGAEPIVFIPSAADTLAAATGATDASNTLEFRLPPNVTVAGIGCSWH